MLKSVKLLKAYSENLLGFLFVFLNIMNIIFVETQRYVKFNKKVIQTDCGNVPNVELFLYILACKKL